MYQVSDKLDKLISGSGRTFVASIGDVQTGFQKIELTSMSTADSYLDVGSALSAKITVSMFTTSTDFVAGKEVEFKLGAVIDGTTEWVPMGLYTISEASKDRNLLTFTAYDRIGTKLSGTYTSTITTYPSESRNFLNDISTQAGITFDTSNLTETINIDRIITIDDQSGEKTYEEPFDGYTMQQVVGYIAMLHSKFAVCDRNGNVVFKWYTDNSDSDAYIIKANRYYDDLAKTETQCAITGLICKTEKGQIKAGNDANLTLTNPIMTNEWLNNVLTHVKDLAFYPASFTCMGDPRLDVGDLIQVVDSTGTAIDVPIMQHSLTFDGGLLSDIASYGIAKSESQSPTDIALQRIRDDMLKLEEITATKINVDQLNVTNLKIQNVQKTVEESVATVTVEYYNSTSATELSGGSWSASQPTWEDGKYVWTRNKTTSNAGVIAYSNAVCITGNTGATGATGDKGDTGRSIGSITNYYLATSASSGVTIKTKGWTESVQSVSETNKYLWNYEVIKYTDNTTASTSTPCIIGTYGDTGTKGDKGDTGATGNGIKGIAEHYAVSTSNSTAPTSWSDTVPTLTTTNKYLWNYETITYTSGSTADTSKRVIGVYGDKGTDGNDGKSIGSIINYYLATSASSGVTTSTAGWTTTVQTISKDKKYLWNYEVIKYSDNTTASTSTPCIIGTFGIDGTNGTNGTDGVGIKSITEYYAASSSNSTAPTSWSGTVPTLTATNRYLWNYETIAYTNNTSKDTAKRVIGVYGSTGDKGDKGDKGDTGATGKGVKSIVPEYYLSTSNTTQTGGSWSTSQPTWETEHYIWTRSFITWTDDTTTTTTPILAEALNSANQQGYDNAQDITTINKTVSKQGTAIETVENQISEKVWTTDITTALEPIQESIDTAQSTADNAVTTTTQNTNSIESLKTATESLTTALDSYTKTTDFEEYKKEVSSQISQTPEAITARFTTLEETITKQGEESSSKWQKLETYIQLDSDGVKIGKTDDPITLELSNGQVCFMQSGEKVAWFTNNQLYVSNIAVTTTATIVGLKVTRSGQHISIS